MRCAYFRYGVAMGEGEGYGGGQLQEDIGEEEGAEQRVPGAGLGVVADQW